MNNLFDETAGLSGNDDLDGWRWSLKCSETDAFLLIDLLSETAHPIATAVAMDEAGPQVFEIHAYYPIEPDRRAIEETLELIGLAPDFAVKAEITKIQKRNWVARSQQNLAPVTAARFTIYGAHDRARVKHRTRMAIEINAAEAFGTAHHGTTRSCLKALDAVFRIKSPHHILDLGTGTGVLAIAAAKARPNAKVLASDIDPIATRTAETNARLNAVNNSVTVLIGAGFDHSRLRTTPKFDLIIANILAGPLKSLSPKFRQHLSSSGTLILSGILTSQAKSVRATFRAHGFIDCWQIIDGEWSTLTMQNQFRN